MTYRLFYLSFHHLLSTTETETIQNVKKIFIFPFFPFSTIKRLIKCFLSWTNGAFWNKCKRGKAWQKVFKGEFAGEKTFKTLLNWYLFQLKWFKFIDCFILAFLLDKKFCSWLQRCKKTFFFFKDFMYLLFLILMEAKTVKLFKLKGSLLKTIRDFRRELLLMKWKLIKAFHRDGGSDNEF